MLHYKNKLMVSVGTEYLDRAVYEKLKELSIVSGWDQAIKQGYFVVSIDDLAKAESLVGRKIEIEEKDVRSAISYCKPLEQELQASTIKKGKGEIMVSEMVDKFVVTTYDKGHAQKTEVPRSLVKTAWGTIKNYPKDEYVASQRVAKNILKALDIREFNRGEDKSDFSRFDWRSFIGHRDKAGTGKGYFIYFYPIIKVIQALRLVKHFNGGTIRRIADDYDFDQTNIGFKAIVVKEYKGDDQKLIGWKPKRKRSVV